MIPATKHTNGWQITLMVAATLELLMTLSTIPGTFFGRSSVPSLAGWIFAAKIAIDTMLALAALSLAHKGRVREALLVFAGMIALGFLPFLPLLLYGVPEIVYIAPAPVIAIAIAILATRNQHLGLASALAVLPTAFELVSKVAAAIIPVRGF